LKNLQRDFSIPFSTIRDQTQLTWKPEQHSEIQLYCP